MDTNRPVIIYISAAPNLMAEREALARMIAKLPVTLAWHIVQTPTEAEPIDMGSLLAADLYFLVMGADIRAPVGLELHTAQRANRSVIAFLRQGTAYTPAGEVFVRQARLQWRSFANAAHLSQLVQRLIAEYLIRYAIQYALTPVEVQQLETLLTTNVPKEQAIEGEGAGHSAVLLSRERYTPSEGVIVDDSPS